MAFRLIPREERFFDDFVALAEQIRKGADLLVEMLVPDHPIWDKADEIKEVEHKCDFLTHEIIQRLHRTFVIWYRRTIVADASIASMTSSSDRARVWISSRSSGVTKVRCSRWMI